MIKLSHCWAHTQRLYIPLRKYLLIHVHCCSVHSRQEVKTAYCPPMDEEIMKMWSIYTMALYSSLKTNEMMQTLCKWMDLVSVVLSEATRSRKTKVTYSLSCVHASFESLDTCLNFLTHRHQESSKGLWWGISKKRGIEHRQREGEED